MRVIVTGATGFLGRRLVERLHRDGAEVVALVRDERHGLPEGVRAVLGDVAASASLAEAGAGCECLYHLAALITFDPSQRSRLREVNGRGTANVLAAARRWKVTRSVVVSSACTLGLSSKVGELLDESAVPEPGLADANPYMDSKLLAEREAVSAANSGQQVVIVNPTTVYGPGDRTLNSGTLVMRVARSALLPAPPGGSNVVDVDDVVEGIVAAAERGRSCQRYVLGGANLRFAEILRTVAAVVGRRPLLIPLPRWMRAPVALGAAAAGGLLGGRFLTRQMVGDLFDFKFYSSERARKELGWVPRHSFRESVERAWAYYRREGLV